MKAVLVILACVLAGYLALDCKHSRTNIRDEGPDIPIQTETCKNPNETYCIFASGVDKVGDSSVSFTYRGCYTDFNNMKQHYHDPGCPNGGSIINDAINGKMTCCTGNLCNPASTSSYSPFLLLVLSIFALFYVFTW